MNIEAYNLDSLRKLVRALQAENKELRELLEKAEIPFSNSEVFMDTPVRKEEFDLDQGGRITQQFIDKKLAVRFFSMFWGREDVFARRAKNGNYYPQCDNRWNNALCPKQKGEKTYCGNCEHSCWTELTPEILMNHLLGYREEQIIEDIKECVEKGRTPVVLTKYKEHAKYIYDYVQGVADFTFILYGDNSGKENENIRRQMKEIPRDKSFILVATGQKIGEGFDCPRLDTLMLAAPVSFAGRLEQYVGRVNRDYEGKKDVVVYDYVDSHIGKFENMYLKRLRIYKKIGFKVVSDTMENKQDVNAIYDSGNYMEVFERDLIEAEKEIVISSPHIIREKILRFISIVKARQESGVKITVITETPERTMFGNTAFLYALIRQMQDVGIRVEISEEEIEHFAVIDRSLVWHGGMNLLGKEDAWDNLIRVRDEKVAAELLAMAFEG